MSLYTQALELVDPREEFMSQVAATLHSHGQTQAALAREANIAPALLSRWITGDKQPGLESMLRLDDALQRLLYGN